MLGAESVTPPPYWYVSAVTKLPKNSQWRGAAPKLTNTGQNVVGYPPQRGSCSACCRSGPLGWSSHRRDMKFLVLHS
ncbi:hypothetical protein NQZ68_023297 [Dissostichus eleginoides]|nr:hypothetical protein NQZ68_023297 [Dissostichus eleginoides]